MKTFKKLIFALIFAPILGISMVGIHVYIILETPYKGEPQHFKIKRGEGFSSVNYRLFKNGLIDNAKVFHHYTKYQKKLGQFKTGTYLIKPGMTMVNVLDDMTAGNVLDLGIKVTLPEGKNLFEIAKILAKKKVCKEKDFIRWAKNKKFMQELKVPSHRAEGYLYPDTYKFEANTNPKEVIKTMVSIHRKKVAKLDFSSAPLNLSKSDVINLASIVEKETGAAFERPMIAGLYLNRLRKKMRLYADPTTIYGIFEKYNGNLRKRHLQEKTPYNTYRINGLPAGPIANPGLEAIKAVLRPASHDYLYFVSRNDGTHKFSRNYKEHLKAVAKFQKDPNARAGKSWRDLKQN